MALINYTCDKIPVRVHGRTDGCACPIALFWTGSCVEVNVTGRELQLEYECRGDITIRIEIDGADMYRMLLEDGRHTLTVFRGFTSDKVKNVRIYRENQASTSLLAIHSFTSDGEFSQLPERKLIEFFGDSITSGEGLAGAQCQLDWIPAVFSCRDNYALIAADALGYDHSVVSQSGWGVYCSWNNHPEANVPSLYDKVCAVADTPEQSALGSQSEYKPEKRPDISVVFLGANDSGSFNNPAWVDADGVEHRMRKDESGKPLAEDLEKISDAVYAFAKKLRENQPDSKVLWCWRSVANLPIDLISGTVARFCADLHENGMASVELPTHTPELHGSRSHPGKIVHRMYADAILARLSELGWC